MSEEPRKRSRFDQAPEESRGSRSERRSRSPASRHSESRRSRSPIARSSGTPDAKANPAIAAAAAAAAKINASLEAKRGIQHVDVPPIRSASTAGPKSPTTVSNVNGDIYQQDGDYIKDIEVNDLRNRYTLTKGATQKMIKDDTGADVTTRGNYYPDKTMATPSNPPLYLHVTSQTKEGLEQAVKKIEELMQQELPNLVDERRFRKPRERDEVERDEHGRRKWPEEQIPIDLEPIPGFNLRAQVVGHGGAYVKHIQTETRCRVQIKGRGSGFIETATGQESDEPMYLHVAGPDPNEVQHARELCLDLLGNVKEQYQQFKERGGQRGGYGGRGGGDRGGDHYGGDRGDRGDRYGGRDNYGGGGRDPYDRQDSYAGQQQQQYGYQGGAQSPGDPNAASADPTTNYAFLTQMSYEQTVGYAGQCAQYYVDNQVPDPYAQFGGIATYIVQMWQYMNGQGQQAAQDPAQGYGAPAYPQQQSNDAPPPPPPSNDPPPPPPPGSAPPGTDSGYSAVPPPPGM